MPGATLAAMAIGNIARGGALCQRMLVQAGAIKKLLACLAGPHALDHKVGFKAGWDGDMPPDQAAHQAVALTEVQDLDLHVVKI